MTLLPTRQELDKIMLEVFAELGMMKASIHYASAEYEELLRGEAARPIADVAINLRLEVVDGYGGLRLLRLRLEPENNTSLLTRNHWIKAAFKSRLKFLLDKKSSAPAS